MRLLLDTRISLWAVSDPERLAPTTRAALASPDNAVFVSAATAWEIAIKRALGRIRSPLERWDAVLDEPGLEPLPILPRCGIAAGSLPRHHGNPFDRLLLAQAEVEDLVLVSNDAVFRTYGVRLLAGS